MIRQACRNHGPLPVVRAICLCAAVALLVASGVLAQSVQGAIAAKWRSLGGESGILGRPLTDETKAPDGVGRYNHFSGGSIYWTPQKGAWEVHGAIRDKWAALGWERSVLGYPVTDETKTPDGIGRFNHFSHGSIYWKPTIGAWEVHGAIRDKWAALGWERSCHGYPTTDEFTSGVYRRSNFEHGYILWSARRGAVSHCPVRFDDGTALNPVHD